MRNGFAKRLAAVLLALCMAAALPFVSAFAEGKDSYVVVFTSGDQGVFNYADENAVKEALSLDDTYQVAFKTNDEGGITSIAVQVPAGKNLSVPQPGSITANARYQVSNMGANIGQNTENGLGVFTGTNINRDYMLVPEYELISDTEKYSYTVQFLQQGTDVEVAPTQYGEFYGSTNSVTVNALAVNDFTLVGASTAVVDKDNLAVVFEYTQNVHVNTVTEYVDGDVVVNYNDVNLVGGAGVVGGGDGGAGDGGEEIPDEETPQAGGEDIPDESTPQAGGEEIPDESTPEAGGETAQAGVSMPMVIGGVVGLLAILLIVLVALRKRKGGQEEE